MQWSRQLHVDMLLNALHTAVPNIRACVRCIGAVGNLAAGAGPYLMGRAAQRPYLASSFLPASLCSADSLNAPAVSMSSIRFTKPLHLQHNTSEHDLPTIVSTQRVHDTMLPMVICQNLGWQDTGHKHSIRGYAFMQDIALAASAHAYTLYWNAPVDDRHILHAGVISTRKL